MTLPRLRPAPRPEPLLRHLLGAVLRDVRTEQGRTLLEVADRARVSMPYLSEVERGRKEASSEVLAAIARALGLRLTDLLALAGQELTGRSAARSPGVRPLPRRPVPAPAAAAAAPAAPADDVAADSAPQVAASGPGSAQDLAPVTLLAA